jgi:transcriptional regulator with XRE-family HTH domain
MAVEAAIGLTVPATENQTERQLSDAQSRSVAIRVREELARRRISRQHLADQAKLSISTLEKALAGRRPFTLATTIRLEEALGVSLRHAPVVARAETPIAALTNGVAPADLGYYARQSVSWIEGSYLTLRPSFGDKDAIYAYRTQIMWDDAHSSLVFRESERLDSDFAQQGTVSVPNQSGFIYLVTNRQGQYRLVIISRPVYGEMFGIMTTLQVKRGNQFLPVATPIAYLPLTAVANPEFGRIPAGHPCYEGYSKYLRRTVEEPFAQFLPCT